MTKRGRPTAAQAAAISRSILLREVIAAKIADWGELNSRKNWMLTGSLEDRLARYATWILAWATHPEVSAIRHLATHAWPTSNDVGERLEVLGLTSTVDLIESEIVGSWPPERTHDRTGARQVAMTLMAMISGWLSLHPSCSPLSDEQASEAAATMAAILVRGADAW